MNQERAKRKLTAILSADVKGYSRLMGEDELATIETLKKYKELISSLTDQFRGRVVDSPGDNLLAEFGSVVDAVECAVKIQEELKKENAQFPESRKMEFRIGVNLGDVVEDGERIYGDGVNIAARLESLAEPGGICISGFVYNQVKNRLKLEYEYLGEQSVKNIKEPVPVYRVLSLPGAVAQRVIKAKETAEEGRMAFPLPDKPSIAVLPFVNMSEDSKQEFLSDGISEDIITILSKNSNLFVIARNSSFTYKGKPVKVQQVSEDLGVRYILEGSLQKSEDRVRITAQLVDALTGKHIWAERYDRDLKDIFLLQDEIAMHVLEAMELKLTAGRRVHEASVKGTKDLEAYIKVVEGMHYFDRLNPDDHTQAKKLFEEAIVLDPEYASPHIFLALAHITEAHNSWVESPMKSLIEASKLVKKGLTLDDTHPTAYHVLAFIHWGSGKHDKALEASERAVELAPNNTMSLWMKGLCMYYMGQPQEALSLFNRQLRIDPIMPFYAFWGIGLVNEMMGRYEEAIIYFKKVLAINPTYLLAHQNLACSYAGLERYDEARAEVKEILRLNPEFSAKKFFMSLPIKDQATKEQMFELYLKAGLPE